MSPDEAGARIPAPAIAALITDAMMAVGMLDADAAKVAELMLEADLTGADAHGVFWLPQYISASKAGGVNWKASFTVVRAHRRPPWSTATTAWAIASCAT